MNVQLRCGEHIPAFEIEYEIGTTYIVCSDCAELKHFARGIKNKKEIGSTLRGESTLENTTNELRYSIKIINSFQTDIEKAIDYHLKEFRKLS